MYSTRSSSESVLFFFFFNEPAPTEISPLPLHAPLPIPATAALGVPAGKIVVLSGFYGLGPTETTTVPPPVEEFLNAHSPVIGAVASIGPEYGLPLVAEAAARLRSAYPRLGLLLMGPAGFARAQLDGSLLVAGQLPHDTALAVMRRLSVFVRPTYFDGDASSVREALALGVPVVASDTDFRPE